MILKRPNKLPLKYVPAFSFVRRLMCSTRAGPGKRSATPVGGVGGGQTTQREAGWSAGSPSCPLKLLRGSLAGVAQKLDGISKAN